MNVMTCYDILDEFIKDIEATGGVFVDEKGHWVLVADPDWIDLATTYVGACDNMNKKPMIGEDPR